MQVDLDTLRGFFRSAPFMADLGVEPTAVEPGRVSTQLVIAQRHCQHTGVVHAGVIAALADHTMGAAAQTMAPDGHWVLTAEFKTSLLRGAAGERLECEAWVLKPGRQVSFTEAEVYAVATGGERKLVAKASGTMAITKA
ncbi:hypothetical protein ASC95_25100 [Pelomonas sp. Root1217]|uniref:PaaI family thioesterase n=1 Tax=Pelomonas sp. Root1217 TaxID=1736430 RepID=UPI00070B5822|nr:PaaI family thioesterase [Pelomonas sp. Root1217]KQV46809.1 hypothetical protein ASC95_25100 [Pelomonas sp. Root1217]